MQRVAVCVDGRVKPGHDVEHWVHGRHGAFTVG
jgi:hypothetical protein